MKTRNHILLPLAAMAGIAAAITGSANAAVMSFGSLNTTGGDGLGDPAKGGGNVLYFSTTSGWAESPALSSGDDDGGQIWLAAGSITGTSDGDKVAAGTVTIAFQYDYYAGSGQSLLAEVYAWDGSTATLLGSNDFGTVDADNAIVDFSFSVGAGSSEIGQDFQLRFSNAGGYTYIDNITGDFTAIPEPGSLALLGLGGLCLLRRRRK